MLKSWLRKEISGKFPDIEFDILTPPDDKMGDYSINLAFVLAKKNKEDLRVVAKQIIGDLMKDDKFKRIVSITGEKNGFINFFLS